MNFLTSAAFAATGCANNMVIKIGKGGDRHVGFFLLDDGMVKSVGAHYVNAFTSWFGLEFAHSDIQNADFDSIRRTWKDIFSECNDMLRNESSLRCRGIQASSIVILVVGDRYCLMRCGTMNMFRVWEGRVDLISPYPDTRSVLGTGAIVTPEWLSGSLKTDEAYLMCTDNFSKNVARETMAECLTPQKLNDDLSMRMRLNHLSAADYRSSAILLRTFTNE